MSTYIHTRKYVYFIVIINPNNNEDLNKEIKSMLFNEYIRYAEESKYVKNPSKSEAKLIKNNTTNYLSRKYQNTTFYMGCELHL